MKNFTQPTIDFRSDAVTQPTDEMWAAMRAAPPHWSADGADPSVLALEAYGAELTRKAAALFVPTGTMGNLVALMAQVRRGEQVILEAASHIHWSEEWSLAYVCGAMARPLEGTHGVLDPDRVRETILERRFSHRPRTSLVCLENTANAAGGVALTPEQTAAVAAVAHEHGIAVHLDGARLANAHIALGVPIHALTEHVDTVMLGICKGLSAPGGALVCGSRSFIEQARLDLKRIGGGSAPNAGIQAAAALVALQTMIPRLADDHRRARMLADGLAALPGVRIDLATVETNIVMAHIDPAVLGAVELAARLRERGVLAMTYTDQMIRFVLHRHIDDGGVERTVAAVGAALARGERP